MAWSYTNLVIEIIAGVLGSHAAATAVREYGFGAFGHTMAGAFGGAFSGCLLQRLVATTVTASGGLNEPTELENAILQTLAGAIAGGILMLLVGFIKHSTDARP